ncbi:MAG: hypothetical protein MR467_04560 [Bacillales bacterium]|nr:hypothetical protein [Bacillales bacterium]MDY3904260.1 hypothetical protein [Candidatus Enteromonas sp.]
MTSISSPKKISLVLLNEAVSHAGLVTVMLAVAATISELMTIASTISLVPL